VGGPNSLMLDMSEHEALQNFKKLLSKSLANHHVRRKFKKWAHGLSRSSVSSMDSQKRKPVENCAKEVRSMSEPKVIKKSKSTASRGASKSIAGDTPLIYFDRSMSVEPRPRVLSSTIDCHVEHKKESNTQSTQNTKKLL